MDKEKLQKTLQSFHFPKYEEIPDVGLYLDQVVKYINGFLVDFPEMQITTSMVSNYVKTKLIPSPYKKTYSRDQIAALVFITTSKMVLSMDHIRLCLMNLTQFESAKAAYDAFLSHLDQVLVLFDESRVTMIEQEEDSDTYDALRNIVIAVVHKMYLERYFDQLQ